MSSEPKPHDELDPAPPPAPTASEPSTSVDVRSMSKDEAERVLAWTGFTNEEVPTALGVAPQRAKSPAPPSVAPPSASGTPRHVSMPTHVRPPSPPTPDGDSRLTRQGVAPSGATRIAGARSAPTRPPPSIRPPPKRQATLVMDAGAPPNDEPPSITDRPPIVVPAASARAPKAVTQPPPWGNDRVELSGAIPRAAGLPRAPEESIEEISASVFLPDDDDLAPTRDAATGARVEELSGSLLLADETKPPEPARTAPPPSRAPPRLSAPVPRSAPPPPVQPWGSDDVPLPADVPIPPPPDVISHPAWPPLQVVPTPKPMNVEPPPAHVETLPLPMFRPDLPAAAPTPDGGIAEKISEKVTHFLPPSSRLRGRPKAVVGLALGGAGLVLLLLVAFFAAAFSGRADGPTKTAVAGVARRVAASIPAAPSATEAPVAPASPAAPSVAPCAVVGSAHVVSPRADMHVGVEARVAGGAVALAFAPTPKDALVVSLDPSTLSASATARARAAGSIRRLTPVASPSGVGVVVDTDKKGDRIRGRRFVSGDAAVDVGVAGSSIVAAPHGSNDTSTLWSLDDDAPLDALRGVSFSLGGKRAYAITYRRAGSVFAGVFSGDAAFSPQGALARFDGLGPKVGSPTIAVSGENVVVAWADRRGDSDPWSVRLARFHAGDATPTADTFVAPAGGLGENVMSPRASPLPGGRFLLVWAEGPLARTQVRAATLAATGALLGPAMTVSADGVNSGAGDSAVTEEGRGIIGFVASSAAGGKKYEVDAVAVSCPM